MRPWSARSGCTSFSWTGEWRSHDDASPTSHDAARRALRFDAGMSYDLTPGLRRAGYGPHAARGMLFSGTVLGLIGVTNIIQGTAALSGSKVYPDNAVFEFGNLRLWGWVVLIAGLAQLVASFAIFSKSSFARWLGIATAAGNAFTQLLVVTAHPAWALTLFAADLFVTHVLVRHAGRGPSRA